MEQIIMYQCDYCNKQFKTKNRHVCKFDPQYRNCMTCCFFMGIEEVNQEIQEEVLPFCPGEYETKEASYRRVKCKCNQEISLETLVNRRWKLYCEEWEPLPGVGKKAF